VHISFVHTDVKAPGKNANTVGEVVNSESFLGFLD